MNQVIKSTQNKTWGPHNEYPMEPQVVAFPKNFPAIIFPDTVHDDQISTLHIHNGLELGVCHDGEGIFVIGNKVLSYKAGDAIIINDREAHRAQSRNRIGDVFTWIYLDVGPLLSQFSVDVSLFDISPFCGKSFCNIISQNQSPEIYQAISLIVNELRLKNPEYQQVTRSLVLYLMLLLYRYLPKELHNTDAVSTQHLCRIHSALSYISGNFSNKIEISALAEMCNMSIPHFRRIFNKAIGKNPLDYLMGIRLTMACLELKSTTKSADHIASDTGFPTFSCFLRKFKEAYGITPHQWRRQ